MHSVRICTLPVLSALGMYVTSILDFAEILQPRRQVPALMQAGRPFQSLVGMARGSRTRCNPNLSAPRFTIRLARLNSWGGVGKGCERGGSKGLAPAPSGPETPSSYSTLV